MQQLNLLNGYLEALNKLAPNTGACVNEADLFETNYNEIFKGANCPRLLSIKKVVDPYDVFWCRACVGNKRMQEVGVSCARSEGGELSLK